MLALAACTRSSSPIGLHEVSIPMPKLTGRTVQGGTLHAAALGGHVLVLNVWATWCGPCEREQPALEQVASAYAAKGVRFVGVQFRDNLAAGKEWVRRFGVSYPSVEDPSGSYSDDLGFFGLPDTYVTDRSGTTIKFAIYGETDAQQLSDAIDHALATSA
jgi:cytochrome c biogenesis protein CcmG, thiol:disulfide interchange protein DsbE